MLFHLAIIFFTYVTLKLLLSSDPSKIRGIYSEPGKFYWLKYWAFYVILTLRQRQNRKNSSITTQDAGRGKRSKNTIEEMECAQQLPSKEPKAVDAVYFNGANDEGYYFVGATARRQNKLTQTLLYLRIPGLGLLEIPSLPDTCLYRDNEMEFGANGFKITPVHAMKEWKLSYSGQMRLVKSEEDTEEVKVSFDLSWQATTKYFDFDTDLDVGAMCESMAREKWSRDFFQRLKKLHQTHHEQFGEITGTVHIENYDDRNIKLQGVRDHSYGDVRDWKDIHRYAIQYIHLEDGTDICIGNICFPLTTSRLIIGYVLHPDGSMDKVYSTDLQLYAIGEDGVDPDRIDFKFIAGGKDYNVRCDVLARPIFYMGYSWEARIHERMCKFTINNTPGWGISEWDYHNTEGRPEKYRKENEPASNVQHPEDRAR